MKNILVICDGSSGGIFDYSRVLCKRLSNTNFLFRKKEGIWNRLIFYKKIFWEIMAKKGIVDIQGLIWPVTLFLIPIAKLRGHKVLSEAHDDPLTSRTSKRPMFARKLVLNLSDMIIVHSRYSKKILNNLGYQNVEYIPLATSIEKPRLISKTQARKKLGISQKRLVILFFGVTIRQKGLDILLKALARLKRENPLLIIAGRIDDDWSFYESIIQELGLEKNILKDERFVPWKIMSLYFATCDLVATPYREITNSVVPFTAYQYKRPVVATNIAAFREIVRNGKTGILVEPDNPVALARGIKHVWKEKLTDRFGRAGYRLLEKEYSWDVVEGKYRNLFTNIY